MARVLEFKKNDAEMGISVRTQIEGPESALMNEFIEQYKDQLSSLKRHYALFYEPLMPTGYPDLVVVKYNPQKYESWTKERAKLNVLDLKVLHHLYFIKGSTSPMLEKHLGMDARILLRTLERLMDASLIKRAKNQWLPRPLKITYGILNMKTIEAKISDWNSVFNQANMNRWFSSESYVLSPVSKPSSKIIDKAKSNGIGIYSMPSGRQAKIIQKPKRSNGLPISYASWLFNEWICRQLLKEQRV